MNVFLNIDYRRGWLATILTGLAEGIADIDKTARENDWFDGSWQCEYAEPIVGLACTAAQAYLVGVVSDVGRFQKLSGAALEEFVKKRKISFYRDDPSPLICGKSRLILINATANYYKHNDEWGSWSPQNPTVRSLADYGIDEHTEFPCLRAVELLFGANRAIELGDLLPIVTGWQEHIVAGQHLGGQQP
jgi:hypothetical protein